MQILLLFLLAASLAPGAVAGDPALGSPHLLLTPHRLHRLKLDYQRKTVRWMDFENRVKTVADSPQRGFELALYYAVTGDRDRGKEAAAWADAHPCQLRQDALIRDWLGTAQKRNAKPCQVAGTIALARDRLFQAIAAGLDSEPVYKNEWKSILASLQQGAFRNSGELYAAIEFIDAVQTNLHVDPREDDSTFFSLLPTELLLSLTPQQVEHPDWMMHAAALALVSLDPNLPGSQYLQGWVMESRQMLRTGPGAAYDFLWADPYLPGIGYQNLDPWAYDPHGRLFARTDWSSHACWVGITAKGIQEQNCPAGWRGKPQSFGRLMLRPMEHNCVMVTRSVKGDALILWKLQPGQAISYRESGKKRTGYADSAGLWRVPNDAPGKVCRSR